MPRIVEHIMKEAFLENISFEDLLGKVLLIGLTYYTHDNVLIERQQYCGTVIESNNKTICIKQKNGELFSLPPDLSSTKPAPPGEYRLRSTGETVINPDFLSTWNVNEPPEQ